MSKIRIWIFIAIIFAQQVWLFLLYAQEHQQETSSIGIPTSSEEASHPLISDNTLDTKEDKNLIISEVFFQWNNEFIEIANLSDLDYQGEITLRQDSKKQLKIAVQIPAHQTKIFARSNQFQGDYKLNFPLADNAAITLALSDEHWILDTFDVEESLVKKLNSAKTPTSFEKIYQNGNRTILPTTAERSRNNPQGTITNPRYFNKEEQNEQAQNSDSDQSIPPESGDNQDPNSDSSFSQNTPQTENTTQNTASQLILTEAFFNKDNNRVEISNISDENFEGEVSIDGFAGNKKATTNLTIPAQSSIILAKNTKYLAENLNIKTYKNFPTIDWKKDLNLVLTTQDQSDSMRVHLDRVKRINGADQSFEKVLIDGQWITTRNMERKENIRGKIIANPWIYFTQIENLKDISQPRKQVQTDPWTTNDPKCEKISDQYLINIKEVFAGNTSYPAFVEVEFVDDPKDFTQIRLSWPAFQQEVVFDKNEDFWEKGKIVLLSSSNQRSEKGIDSLFLDTFVLNNQWWEAILEWWNGQDRQILDIAQLPAIEIGKSFYQNKNQPKSCIKNFDQTGDFSPWFDRKFLEYFKIETTPRVEYIYVNKWGGGWGYSCPTKADLCPIPEVKQKEEKKIEKSDSNLDQSPTKDDNKEKTEVDSEHKNWQENNEKLPVEAQNYQVKIEDLVYDPPGADGKNESITLLLTKGDQLDLKKTNLSIDGKNKKLTGLLKYWESKKLIGNFGFPNTKKDKSNVVVQIKIGSQILDTFVYTIPDKTTTEKEKKQEAKKEGIKVFSVLDGDTFRYKDSNWKLQSVRLLWVDSPESNTARYRKTECYGKESKQALTNLIKGKTVKLEFDQNQSSTDNYGRQLAYVRLDDLLVNQHLIAEGYAKEYTFKTAYSKQSEFQSAQSQAKEKKIWLWSPVHCPNNLENEQDSQENSKNLVIKITAIDYDPKGTDKDKERLTLSIFNKNKDISHIDFAKQWGILVFDWTKNYQQLNLEEIENNKGKFIDLSHFGQKAIINPLVLTGNFNFPNTKSSCIALFQKDHLYDITCYEVKSKEKPEETKQYYGTGAISITSILPNPKGKDQGKEFIELRSHLEENIELSSWFTLLINGKTKKKISGQLLAGEKKRFVWNFSFSNDHSCVSIMHQSQILDTFCYGKEKEGSIISQDKTILAEQTAEDLAILKKIKFVKNGNQRCIAYQDVLLRCRNIPRSKADPLLKAESNMYRKAFKLFNQILRENYSPLYYQSDLKPLFDLIKEGKNDIKQKKTQIQIYWEPYDRSDFDKIYQAKYEQQLWKQGVYFFKQLLGLQEEKQA